MEKLVCFIGHRKINDTPKLRERIKDILIDLIKSGAVNFIFGDRSEFNGLCYELVTNLKREYSYIKRIHFRKNYENADGYTMQFLISGFEESICPKGVANAGKASYIKRNRAMIEESDICIFYYDENYRLKFQKRGTALAYIFAESKNKRIINCFL